MGTMIDHEGIIQAVANGKASILVQTGGCSSCGQQSGCGIGRLAGNRTSTLMTLPADESIQPGQRVVLGLPQGIMVKAALLAYLLPAVTVLLGAAFGFACFGSDGATALGAATGLFIGVLLTRGIPGWVAVPKVRAAALRECK